MALGWLDYDLSQELRVISEILDIHPVLYDKALEYITQGKITDRGARGMSWEQVVRCAILIRMHGLSNKKLSFHLADSESFKEFVRNTPSIIYDWHLLGISISQFKMLGDFFHTNMLETISLSSAMLAPSHSIT